MKNSLVARLAILALATTCGIAWVGRSASAQDCLDIDPSGTIAKVHGDFEIGLDPNDPAQHMIFLNHVAKNGPSDIVVAQMDGVTAQIVPGSLTTIADNYQGELHINGPEFFMPPGAGLGALYRNLQGVHGVFRPATPKAWNDFSVTIDGQPAGKSPPRISSSPKVSYETGNLPLGQNTYTLFKGPCTFRCFASVREGVPTDPYKVFKKTADLTIPTIESVVQSERDYVIYAEACTKNARANGVCGIYEAQIDLAGGLKPDSLKILTTLPTPASQRQGRLPLDWGIHPATGSTVFFVEAEHQVGPTVDVYERKVLGGPLNLIASVPAQYTDHFRTITSGTQMVMHYLVRPLGGRDGMAGSYVIAVNASGGSLQVGTPQKVADVSGGAEVEYLPAAGKFAVFYLTNQSPKPTRITRCFFQP